MCLQRVGAQHLLSATVTHYKLYMWYIYILKGSSNPQYYIGFTQDLKLRLEEHNKGSNSSTKRGRPWKILYYEAYCEEILARQREEVLKKYGKAWQALKKRISSI